jgi:hypothetical protein
VWDEEEEHVNLRGIRESFFFHIGMVIMDMKEGVKKWTYILRIMAVSMWKHGL